MFLVKAAGYLAMLAPLSKAQVVWMSPVAGDVYGNGDVITGRWRTDGGNASSVIVRLCLHAGRGNETCGDGVNAMIVHDESSTSVSLGVPNVTYPGNFHLQLRDQFGLDANSPIFIITRQSLHDVDGAIENTPESPGGPASGFVQEGMTKLSATSDITNITLSHPSRHSSVSKLPVVPILLGLGGGIVIVSALIVSALWQTRRIKREGASSKTRSTLRPSMRTFYSRATIPHDVETGAMTAAKHQQKLKLEREKQHRPLQYKGVGYTIAGPPRSILKREGTQRSAESEESHWKLFADDDTLPKSSHPIGDYYSKEGYLLPPPSARVHAPPDSMSQTYADNFGDGNTSDRPHRELYAAVDRAVSNSKTRRLV